MRHGLTTLHRGRRRIDRQLVGLARAVGILLHRGTELLHGGSGLLQRTGLVFGARRQLGIGLGNGRTRRGDALGAIPHIGNHLDQVVLHFLESNHQTRRFIATAGVELGGQISLCHSR